MLTSELIHELSRSLLHNGDLPVELHTTQFTPTLLPISYPIKFIHTHPSTKLVISAHSNTADSTPISNPPPSLTLPSPSTPIDIITPST